MKVSVDASINGHTEDCLTQFRLNRIAVILNEHLTEAMRRMKEESNENNVDR
jgi:hypothetical protein